MDKQIKELDRIFEKTNDSFFAVVEYNRNVGGTLKILKKTIQGTDEQIVTNNCDLIVHSRGKNVFQDNLIAIEIGWNV